MAFDPNNFEITGSDWTCSLFLLYAQYPYVSHAAEQIFRIACII